LGDYNELLPEKDYKVHYDGDVVKVMHDAKEVMSYPVDNLVCQNPALLDDPENLCVYCNDSLMLVLKDFTIRNGQVQGVNLVDYMLFRKKQ
jgi:hypothetical protein